MALQPIGQIGPASPLRPGEGTGALPNGAGKEPAPAQDQLTLSDRAKAAAEAARKQAPLPRFGQFQLGGPAPLAFGPDQNASALTKIPDDGYRKPVEGVDLGHQPTRGINLLA